MSQMLDSLRKLAANQSTAGAIDANGNSERRQATTASPMTYVVQESEGAMSYLSRIVHIGRDGGIQHPDDRPCSEPISSCERRPHSDPRSPIDSWSVGCTLVDNSQKQPWPTVLAAWDQVGTSVPNESIAHPPASIGVQHGLDPGSPFMALVDTHDVRPVPDGSDGLIDIGLTLAVEEAMVPRKVDSSSHHDQPFVTAVESLAYDPRKSPHIARLHERICEVCQLPGSCAVFSISQDPCLSEILGSVALLHAVGRRKRVVLIDANLECPQLTRHFGLSGEPGLTNAYHGQAEGCALVRPTLTPGLAVLPVGTMDGELDSRSHLASLMARLVKGHDLVLVDGGRAQCRSAMPIARACDQTILHVQLGGTSRVLAGSVAATFRANGIHIHGVIVTNVPSSVIP